MQTPYGAWRAGTKVPLLLLAVFSLATLPPGAAWAEPVRILALGDSLTAGYGLPHADGFEAQLQDALRAKGQDVRILDGGVSGDTSAGGRARLDWALADKPDAAIVELGGNDGLRGIDPKDTEANLAAILDRLAAERIPVLLSGMYAPPNLGKPYGDAFRAVFDRLGQRPGVIYDPFFLAGVAPDPRFEQADRIHPNAEGVKRIVSRMLPDVEKLIAEARDDKAGNNKAGNDQAGNDRAGDDRAGGDKAPGGTTP